MKKISTNNTVTLILLCCLLICSKLTNAQCHIDDWTALKALYEATDGDNWNNNRGWDIVKNNEPTLDCNLRSLRGVDFDENGRVDYLVLPSHDLKGNIPAELSKLNNLVIMDLGHNFLTGNIPAELGNLINLTKLKLSQNQLSGIIPVELSNATNLKDLSLLQNQLSGNIPSELGNLINLEYLYLNQNQLSGNIPSELGNLINLEYLNLNQNQLSGSIPSEFNKLNNLYWLKLENNQLSGIIPKELGKMNNLADLNLSNNQLSGNFPLELIDMITLRNLDLSNNMLTGSIPAESKNLSYLNLSANQLSGPIPSNLEYYGLYELNLSNNLLSGKIPAELGNLNNLVFLYLNNNQLNGSIPSELGSLKELYDLDLSFNQLTGSIPSELGSLKELYLLDLSFNQLTGSIPTELSNLEYIYFVILSNNQLSGSIQGLDFDSGLIEYYDIRFNYYNCDELYGFTSIPYYDPLRYKHSPQFYKHSANQSILINDSSTTVSLSAPYEYDGNFTYQWYKNETIVENATDSILFLNSIQFEDVGKYALHIKGDTCIKVISDPISVRRTDLEGCTDQNSCNYNQFAFIDDGSCEYLWCDTMTNPIKIRTTNEVILSDTQIKFDLVIDSLGLDYSADNLTFTLDTRGNYRIDSIQVINPILSPAEVDISKLYKNNLSINRLNNQRLASGKPILSAIACIPVDDVPTDEMTCSHFVISGGTQITSGHFIDFDNVYIDIPFSDCSPYGNYGAEGKNWLPLVLTVSPQNCDKDVLGLAEIKILEEGQSPFSYTLKNEQGVIVLEATNANKLIELPALNAGNYELTVFDMDGKKTTMHTCIPLVNSLDGNETCQTNCVDYVIVPDGEISGLHQAKKEIEIKGFVGKDKTVEFGICE